MGSTFAQPQIAQVCKEGPPDARKGLEPKFCPEVFHLPHLAGRPPTFRRKSSSWEGGRRLRKVMALAPRPGDSSALLRALRPFLWAAKATIHPTAVARPLTDCHSQENLRATGVRVFKSGKRKRRGKRIITHLVGSPGLVAS